MFTNFALCSLIVVAVVQTITIRSISRNYDDLLMEYLCLVTRLESILEQIEGGDNVRN